MSLPPAPPVFRSLAISSLDDAAGSQGSSGCTKVQEPHRGANNLENSAKTLARELCVSLVQFIMVTQDQQCVISLMSENLQPLLQCGQKYLLTDKITALLDLADNILQGSQTTPNIEGIKEFNSSMINQFCGKIAFIENYLTKDSMPRLILDKSNSQLVKDSIQSGIVKLTKDIYDLKERVQTFKKQLGYSAENEDQVQKMMEKLQELLNEF